MAKSFYELMGKEYIGLKWQTAVNKLMEEKQGHVKGAFYRDDIGNIDLFWGDDSAGLCHILKERGKRGTSSVKFIELLADVIEKGVAFQGKNHERLNIAYKGKVAIIAFELRGVETTALLTAFYTKNEDRSSKEG